MMMMILYKYEQIETEREYSFQFNDFLVCHYHYPVVMIVWMIILEMSPIPNTTILAAVVVDSPYYIMI